ncbi:cytochrome c biogenesis protein CcsA [Aridibaculum aurantiacum]|uniref:cytochrome c biogenesis protein CcsA n=1 Tax=Aridibaculum aurantiacum TaxID=2810307 RepID=UPI001A97496E|nr:cytochrome c biogenesis protein CcsA [Aridibaculum aurantiacum]
MEFVGEHLLPGKLGHFFAILSLVASLVATIAFFKTTNRLPTEERTGWLRIARIAFLLETISVLALFVTLYYIISNHLFEYKYAWQHSSRALQVEYLLSCFWEGQEGSFMLWSFWHCVLGWIIIWKAGRWEAPVMTVVSFMQFTLATMLLGIYFFGFKVGSSPYVLLRNEMQDAPIFSQPNYLEFVKDGNGLNALLQNYWMVIHPPVLFLGFASTLIPFAYAMAGLWLKDHKGWTKPAIPWAAFSAATLGVGIMMGAAWAYESLTFGGYWAWDPVENASLVPWLILIAGFHTNLIFRSSGYSLKSTYIFYILAFVFVLYSTFLTRSGVLGDTSVHAFTDLGMNVQLVAFMLVFFVPAMILYFIRRKDIPTIVKEENTYSREFWMFLGSLVLFLSSMVIIVTTSLPVINKIIGTNWAMGEDPEGFHNQVQIFVAIIIGLLTAITQYLKYKDTPKAYFFKRLTIPTLIALIISLSISIWGGIGYEKNGVGFLVAIHLAIFAAIYAVVANTTYIWAGFKGKMKAAGASVAHIGFGLILVGILISSSKKTVLSYNTTGMSPLKMGDKESPLENITLIKGVATDMGKYMVTYVGDSLNNRDRKRYYQIDFAKKNSDEKFSLYPDIIENNKGQEGVTPNPDARHYWHKDIFTYLTFLGDPTKIKAQDTSTFKSSNVRIGDTLFYSKGIIIIDKVVVNPSSGKYAFTPQDTALALNMSIISKEGNRFTAQPLLQVSNGQVFLVPDTVMAQSLVVNFSGVKDQEKGLLEIGVRETSGVLDFVTLKAYEFPFINVLWLGIVVMLIGFIMSIVYRVKHGKHPSKRTVPASKTSELVG